MAGGGVIGRGRRPFWSMVLSMSWGWGSEAIVHNFIR